MCETISKKYFPPPMLVAKKRIRGFIKVFSRDGVQDRPDYNFNTVFTPRRFLRNSFRRR